MRSWSSAGWPSALTTAPVSHRSGNHPSFTRPWWAFWMRVAIAKERWPISSPRADWSMSAMPTRTELVSASRETGRDSSWRKTGSVEPETTRVWRAMVLSSTAMYGSGFLPRTVGRPLAATNRTSTCRTPSSLRATGGAGGGMGSWVLMSRRERIEGCCRSTESVSAHCFIISRARSSGDARLRRAVMLNRARIEPGSRRMEEMRCDSEEGSASATMMSLRI
mmetsp:Transcript_27450/g.64957  ORF Transcript_27450/g.64957 Transcript_27450/m.64957 type:complete len:222 (-) Transcript_27450:3205-3870(-)